MASYTTTQCGMASCGDLLHAIQNRGRDFGLATDILRLMVTGWHRAIGVVANVEVSAL